ncbi:hypothetical protein NQ314_007732 [Rhamnusium bicolor]|uniref:Cobalamin adenosyltransferase-like domain-containing protein n=1 Tax=Rhamnusium bicolor TaxID=1586634 RepID=A0AAV8YH00_9CUCU|nr:hypothetical protein NQ314_007732 [Rhamnusium bicolor]
MVFRRMLHARHLTLIRTYSGQKEYVYMNVRSLLKFGRKKNITISDLTNSTQKKPKEIELNIPESFSRLGDDGTSKTIDGNKLPKDNQVFNAIGATEELLSFLGLAREHSYESEQQYTDKLKRIQTIIIDISTAISRSSTNKATIPPIYTKELEDWIHEYSSNYHHQNNTLYRNNFILSCFNGGGVASASLHVARSICRKTERLLVPLVRQGSLDMEAQIYLNRLSDFLFTISRIAAKHDQRAETIYIPKPDEKVQAQ